MNYYYTLAAFFASFQIIALYGMESNLPCLAKENALIYAQAEEHNAKNLFLSLPHEDFDYVMTQVTSKERPINETITDCLALNVTCKALNDIPYLGNCLQHYPDHTKNRKMRHLLWDLTRHPYKNYHNAFLLLLHAGAKHTAYKNYSLLEVATQRNYTTIIQTLLERQVNPNSKNSLGKDIFFYANTVSTAQLFLKRDVNLNAPCSNFPNVLWKCLDDNKPTELLKLYLRYGANPEQKDSYNGNCLLHKIFTVAYVNRETVELLLTEIPDMINTLNKNGQTPLDVALTHKMNTQFPTYYEELIELFRDTGALTAEKLKNTK